MKKLLTLTLLSCLSLAANAADKQIFSCTAENGEPINVVKSGSDYVFTFGKTTFKNPIKQVFTNEESVISTGSGFVTSSLEMKNAGTSYIVSFSQPRNNLKELDEPSLALKTNGSIGDIHNCNQSKQVIAKFETKAMRQFP